MIAVKFMHKHVSRGSKVYVHCNSGVGRSAVIVVAYLVSENGWTLEKVKLLLIFNSFHRYLQAYEYLQRKRAVVKIPRWFGIRPHWRRLLMYSSLLISICLTFSWNEQHSRVKNYEDELAGTEPISGRKQLD